MPRWWPRPSPAVYGGRARTATGEWLPGTSIASVVEELKLDCTTQQLQLCVRLCACSMYRGGWLVLRGLVSLCLLCKI